METILTWLVISFAGLLVSAHTRLTGAVGHVSFSVPLLLLVALAVVLVAAAAVLAVARLLVRDGLRLRPVAS